MTYEGKHRPAGPVSRRRLRVGAGAFGAIVVALGLTGGGVYAAADNATTTSCVATVSSTYQLSMKSCQLAAPVQPTVTVPGPTITVTTTVTASPSASSSSTPPSSSTPSPSATPTTTGSTGFPDASTTGPTGPLIVRTGSLTVPAGATLSGYDLSGSVTLGAGATLANSRVRCENENDFCVSMGRGSTLSAVEVGGGADGSTYTSAIGIWTGGPGNTITRTDVHHVSDGLRLDGGTTLSDSWIHDLVTDQITGVHSDGIQVTAGSAPIVLVHDSIEGGTNDALFDETSSSPLSVDRCLFTANTDRGNQSSYGVAVYPQLSSASVSNSVFTRGWQVAPIMLSSGASSGNTYTDGTPIS